MRKLWCIKAPKIPEMVPFADRVYGDGSETSFFIEGKVYTEELYNDPYNVKDDTLIFRSEYPDIAYTYEFIMEHYQDCFVDVTEHDKT